LMPLMRHKRSQNAGVVYVLTDALISISSLNEPSR
jgi:hypothetical protein